MPSQLPYPHDFFVYCIVNIRQFMGFLYISIFLSLPESSISGRGEYPGQWPLVPDCRVLFRNERGLAMNLSDPTVESSQYVILLCSETLVSLCVMYRSCCFPVWVAMSCCAGVRCLGPEAWRHTYWMDMENFANPNLSVVVSK